MTRNLIPRVLNFRALLMRPNRSLHTIAPSPIKTEHGVRIVRGLDVPHQITTEVRGHVLSLVNKKKLKSPANPRLDYPFSKPVSRDISLIFHKELIRLSRSGSKEADNIRKLIDDISDTDTANPEIVTGDMRIDSDYSFLTDDNFLIRGGFITGHAAKSSYNVFGVGIASEILSNILMVGRTNGIYNSSVTSTILDPHTDFNPPALGDFIERPTTITIYCLSGDKGVETYVVNPELVISQLDQDTIDILTRKIFYNSNFPPSYKFDLDLKKQLENQENINSVPLITEDGKINMSVNLEYLKCDDLSVGDIQKAVDKLRDAILKSPQIGVVLDDDQYLTMKGDALHGRTRRDDILPKAGEMMPKRVISLVNNKIGKEL